MTRLLLLDNNCLNALRSPTLRDSLARTIRDEGREFWPTAANVLEAISTTDAGLRIELLAALHSLAGDSHVLPTAGSVLEAVARARASDANTISLGEPRLTGLLRHPTDAEPELLAEIREQLQGQEARFGEAHDRAKDDIRDRILADGGRERWPTVGSFLDEAWSRPGHLEHYVEALWRLWELPEPVRTQDMLAHDAWRLYFEHWGAAFYARAVQHPQPRLVQSADLRQLTYLGMAPDAVLVTEDKGFRSLAAAMLDGRYDGKRVVPLAEGLPAA